MIVVEENSFGPKTRKQAKSWKGREGREEKEKEESSSSRGGRWRRWRRRWKTNKKENFKIECRKNPEEGEKRKKGKTTNLIPL